MGAFTLKVIGENFQTFLLYRKHFRLEQISDHWSGQNLNYGSDLFK